MSLCALNRCDITRPYKACSEKLCKALWIQNSRGSCKTRNKQAFSAALLSKGQTRARCATLKERNKIFRELVFQSYIPNLHQKVCSVPPLRLVFVICLKHFFSKPCFQGNADFLTLNSPAWHLLLKTLLANYRSGLPTGPHSSILY